ncbi:MAG: tannase/feruloyl esterase family alpha/beta hydrolase [Croceibacterium sp.]
MKLLATVALTALVAGCAMQPQGSRDAPEVFRNLAGADRCAAILPSALGATQAAGTWVAAANGLPAYCEVKGNLSPAPGSMIGVVYRLPEGWNGKVLGLGGGGWQGNVTLQAATEGLRGGYATMQTDAGHVATTVWDTAWANSLDAQKDFSYRGVHEMTEAGKKLVEYYYGREPGKAYFQGCSTGGRMALMEAQRYPADYDAISAGAPVYSLQVQTSSILRNMAFHKDNSGFSADDLKLAQTAALNACDAQDGARDGLINNPQQCHWDPGALQCGGAKNATCLAPAQVAALRTVYDGTRTADGDWGLLPMNRGGEPGWSAFVGTDGKGVDASSGAVSNLFSTIQGGKSADFNNYTLAEVQAVRRTQFADWYEAKDANLAPFFRHGGKLLLWHGNNDPGPSPIATADYARAVLGKTSAANQSMRLFLLPGVEHCGGGPGAAPIPLLDTIDSWVSTGAAPQELIGAKADHSVVRLQCSWPNVAHYKGSGDVNTPANWQCASS